MLKLHVTSSQFCLYLLNIYHFTCTFSQAHTEAHTHKHTCTISKQEEWRQPGTGAWRRGAEERLLFETKTLHIKNEKKRGTKISGKTRSSRIYRTRFEHIQLLAKLLDDFLRSNKSNINQKKGSGSEESQEEWSGWGW